MGASRTARSTTGPRRLGRSLGVLGLLAGLVSPASAGANGVSHSLAFACEGQTTKVTVHCGSGGMGLPCSPRSQISLSACTGCARQTWSRTLALQVTAPFACSTQYSCSQTEEGTLDVPCDQLADFDMLCAEGPECRPMDISQPGDLLSGCELLPWSTLGRVPDPYECAHQDGGVDGDGSGSGCSLAATQAGVGVAFALLLGLGLVMARRRR
jgi:hypothetical protein